MNKGVTKVDNELNLKIIEFIKNKVVRYKGDTNYISRTNIGKIIDEAIEEFGLTCCSK